MNKKTIGFLCASLVLGSVSTAWGMCSDIGWTQLNDAVAEAEKAGDATGGYKLKMWATVVDESGKVCWVTTSGTPGAYAGNSEWLGSRVISAQKANTANAFSLDAYAISTANLYSAVQPGGSLYGLQASNPVTSDKAYAGNAAQFGTKNDPMKGQRIGGVNVFGGGLALYATNGRKIGALGVSGDTSCRDHAYAWRIRAALNMHPTKGGITTHNMDADNKEPEYLTGASKGDEMILSNPNDTAENYWNAWVHPLCPNSIPAISADNGTLQIPTPTP